MYQMENNTSPNIERDFIFNTPSGEMPIDAGILPAVEILNNNGFETFESCEGGEGHAYFEPTVRFFGTEFDLIRAYEVCIANGLNVIQVNRVYRKVSNLDKNDKLIKLWEHPFNEIIFHSIKGECPMCEAYRMQIKKLVKDKTLHQ